MNIVLSGVDFAAISPLLILLGCAMALLLMEAFVSEAAKRWSFYVTLFSLVLAFAFAVQSPGSDNPLLTPWLRFDTLARFFSVLFLGIGLASTLLTASFFQRFEATHGEFYFLLVSALFGLILIGAAADFLTLFLGLETLSIALYVLCGYMKKWEFSGEAALKYFLMGALSAAFLLYGIALIYGALGTTSFGGLEEAYHALSEPSKKALFFGGISLVTLGLAFKAAIVPFHLWAPDVYDGASNPVTAFMAVGTKAGAFAAFARLFLLVLPGFDPFWNEGLAWLAIVTMIYANFVALCQVQMRRLFAYSGISHAGFLLIPLIAGTPEALFALQFYLIVYVVATLGCFATFAVLDCNSEGTLVKDLQGLFHRSPWLAALFSVCLLTLAGIPPTAGFFAKFYVFKVAFQAGYYTLVIVGLLTTILSIFYYMRIISVMLSEPEEGSLLVKRTWPAALVGSVVFVALLVFSFYPEILVYS